MNNNMYLYFDSNGYLKEFITCPARAGSENVNSIYFYVEPALESDRNKVDGNGDAYYALPNNVHHGTLDFKLPEVISGVTDTDGNLLIPLTFTSSNYVITDIQPFDKKRDLLFFKWFQKYQFVKVDLTNNILLNAGNVLCTIGCYNSENTKVYNLDLFSFYVADSAVLQAVYITTSQYHELLTMFDEAKSMFDIEKRIVILDDISVPNVIDGYEDNQLIYDKATALYYVVNSSSEDGYEPANDNGLLGNKGALIRFFGLTDTITLQEIYNLIGANRYASLNVDGIEYLVIMGNNNSIKAYDLLEKKLYDYLDAPEDTFADVLNDPATTFVEHVQQANRVYVTNQFAQDTAILYSVNVVNNGIVQRDATGQINVPTTPTYDYNAASKGYVDSNYGKKVQLTIDNDTFVLTVKLLNNNDIVISQASIDLPLESIVVSAQYYETYTYQGTTYEKVLVIELATTSEPIIVPVGDLVSGLVSETTFNNAVAQLQTNINGCVKKRTTSGVFVYGHVSNTESEFALSGNATPNTIPTRDSNGNINVGNTPSSNTSATSKLYVDTFGRTLEFSIDNTTYVMTFRLKDNNGNVISTQTIDLPLETMVVDGSYDDTTESLVLELKNGQTISIPISDLISGLVTDTSLATTLQSYYTKAQIDQMVAGFVFADVDDYLSDSSTNPVENRVITNALDTKANTQDLLDGQLVPNEALQTKSIKPVSQESGATQDTPFVYQGTGTANGSHIVDTGNVAEHLEKQGNSVVVNQLITDNDITGTNTNQDNFDNWLNFGQAFTLINGHKYLFIVKRDSNCAFVRVRSPNGSVVGSQQTSWFIHTCTTTQNDYVIQGFITANTASTHTYYCIDLTLWFGSNDAIPQDLLDNPSNFFRYYNGSLAYNTGTLVDSDGQYLECGQSRNIWNEETELGTFDTTTGENINNITNQIRAKNKFYVIPNTEYCFNTSGTFWVQFYDENLNPIKPIDDGQYTVVNNCVGIGQGVHIYKTPYNARYCRFYLLSGYGTTYKNDITISIYYPTGDGYNQYYPYVQPKVYDTGNEVLKKAGIVKDYKEPNGTIHRLVGIVDLGTLNYERGGTNDTCFATQGLIGVIKPANWSVGVVNAICPLYIADTGSNVYTLRKDMTIGIDGVGKIYIYDNSRASMTVAEFKNAMSGVYLYYELATPTTEQGTPFAENIEINDYSYMAWLDSNNNYVEVPQGCKIFYQADYVLFIDSLGQRDDINWNAENIVSKSQMQQALSSFLSNISGYDSSKTQTLKNVNGVFTWVDD